MMIKRMDHASVVVAILAVALSLSCGSGPAGPDSGVHPVGTASDRLTIDGAPSGIAVASSGTVFVTLLSKRTIAKFAAAGPTTASYIALPVAPTDVVFNRIGTIALVAAADQDRWVVYSVDVGSGTATFARPMQAPPYRIAFSKDEDRLLVLRFGDLAQVYSIPLNGLAGAKSAIQQIPGIARALAVSPTTGALFVTTSARVARLDPVTLEIQAQTGPVFTNSEDVVVSNDGSRVWFGGNAGNLVALDASSLEKVADVSLGADVHGLAMSPDGAQLWATSLGDLVVVDAARASVVSRVTLGGTPGHIAFDRAGTTAFVTNQAGWVDVIR